MISLKSFVRVAGMTSVLLGLCAVAAPAHPLGNFTVNHLSKVRVAPQTIEIRYVLDMAEIPTYQLMREHAANGRMRPAEISQWASAQAATLAPELHLTVDGRPLALHLLDAHARTRPGAGGLPILYLQADYRTTVAPGNAARELHFEDATYPGRLGWKDAIAAPPQSEPTQELLSYPNALLGSPRNVTSLEAKLGAGGVVAVVQPSVLAPVDAAPSAVRSNQLSDMLARGTGDAGFVALTFLVAIFLGALHALEPGHGKTLLAVSLVGARATVKQAAILAAALTVAHTAGVLALGLAINIFKSYFVPEAIYPWITLLSGVAIAIIGARAVQRQLRLRQPLAHVHAHAHAGTRVHEHGHVHHVHPHPHSHGHGAGAHTHQHEDVEHARAHAIPGSAPLKFGATVLAAMSGGIAPCPAALVVLLAAVALNQVLYGIFVIVAFSFGLAATLTGLGIAVVRGAGWLRDRPAFERFVQYGPLVSAVVIATIGAIMVGQGFAQQGIATSPILISLITALAIAGFAFSHPFAARRTAEVA
jgi:nickel/cobalt transporter (NicO) family protein